MRTRFKDLIDTEKHLVVKQQGTIHHLFYCLKAVLCLSLWMAPPLLMVPAASERELAEPLSLQRHTALKESPGWH